VILQGRASTFLGQTDSSREVLERVRVWRTGAPERLESSFRRAFQSMSRPQLDARRTSASGSARLLLTGARATLQDSPAAQSATFRPRARSRLKVSSTFPRACSGSNPPPGEASRDVPRVHIARPCELDRAFEQPPSYRGRSSAPELPGKVAWATAGSVAP